MKRRIIITIAALIAWGVISGVLSWSSKSSEPIIQGDAAVLQLQPTNTTYFISKAGMGFHGFGLPGIILLILLAALWYKPIKNMFKGSPATILIFGLLTATSHAYFAEVNNPEFVNIGPNESAFLVPVAGDNLTNQAQFGSIEYLKQKKQASKRIQIPHTSFTNPGMFGGKTFYVPSAVLTIVDRTPYYQEWRDETDRGTSSKKEGFNFESKDSINLSCGIAISAEVTEEDVATFLYWFGASKTTANPDDPAAQFASVIRGKSLTEIMTTVIRGKVAAVLAREYGKLGTNEAIGSKDKVIAIAESEVTAFAKTKGITIDYVGYCTSLTEDPDVQKAINDRFIAEVQAQAAVFQKEILPVKQQLADIAIKQGIADASAKWNGQINLPSFLVVSDHLANELGGWFKPPVTTDDSTGTDKKK